MKENEPFPFPWKQSGWDIEAADGRIVACCGYNSYPNEWRQELIDTILLSIELCQRIYIEDSHG